MRCASPDIASFRAAQLNAAHAAGRLAALREVEAWLRKIEQKIDAAEDDAEEWQEWDSATVGFVADELSAKIAKEEGR